MKKTSRSILLILSSIILVVGFCLVYAFGLFHSVQEKMTDRLFLNRGMSQQVVVVAIDDQSLNAIGQWPWDRRVMAKAMDQMKNDGAKPKALGIDVSFSEMSRAGQEDDAVLAKTFAKWRAQNIPVVLPLDLDANNRLVSEPISILKASTQQGFINFPLDGDAVVRRAEHVRGDFKSFSGLLSHMNAPDVYRIDYRGTQGFLTIPFVDVLNGKIPPRIFDQKIVLIGVTAPNLHDFVTTPFNQMAGVLANANAIDTELSGRYLHDLPKWIGFALIAFLVLITAWFVHRTQKLWPLLGFVFAVLACVVVGASVLFGQFLLLPVFYLTFTFFGSFLFFVLFEYITTAKEKAFIRNSFQYYLTPQVIDQLVEHPEKLSLGGEVRRMTILFSDIRGFTTLSESLTPEELTQLLNEYLTAMTDIIMDHGGVVDKYIGDAVMAFWGAPLDHSTQALDACQSAIAMIKKLEILNKGWKIPIKIGIGLNTGTVVVGNMGSQKRFNYTVMGDEVNLASRLESLTKYYGVSMLVSEQTRAAFSASKEVWFRELDCIVVKGKKEPTKIFEVLLRKPTTKEKEAHSAFEFGRAAYAKSKWGVAIKQFQKAINILDDGPSKLFLERSKKFKEHPPEKWEGIYSFTEK